MNTHWHLETDDQAIACLHLDVAGSNTNVLSSQVLEEFNQLLKEIETGSPRGLIILSDKPNGFLAGADIESFTRLSSEAKALELIKQGQRIFDRLERLSMPTVCQIHGFCLGGGLELALACRYRVAEHSPSTRLGLPEVRLGIHPGFGGSMRLTRLIGAPAAMGMILTGRTIDPRAAKRMGLVSHAVPERQLHRAARALIEQPLPRPRARGLRAMSNHALVRPILGYVFRRSLRQKARQTHYPAPYAQVDVWQSHGDNPREMLYAEAKSVAQLITGQTAQNLIRCFFLQETLKGLGKGSDRSTRHVHVIGAGVMGGDIAAWCAFKGLRVSLEDREAQTIAPAIKRAHALFKRRLKKPRLIQAAMDRLMPDPGGQGAASADIIIEAIFEDLEAKQAVFKRMEAITRTDTLLATNTSSIPLENIGEVLKQPGRLVGLHFFNPVAKMQLVEVVKGRKTSSKAIAHAHAFTRQIDRLPLPVKSSPGFLVNRILMPYLLEAVEAYAAGIPAEEIDAAALDFGMPLGPIELADTVGLDICLSVARILSAHLKLTVPNVLEQRVGSNKLGRKTGEGFYVWKDGKIANKNKSIQKTINVDLQDRLILRMLNEAMACLRQGVVKNEDLVDAGMVFGTGFAPFRGGPMHYLEHIGLAKIKARLNELAQRYDDRFKPDRRFTHQARKKPS